MAFRGVLPSNHEPSLQDRFAKGFGAVAKSASGLTNEYATNKKEKDKQIATNLSKLSGSLKKELQNRGKESLASDPRYLAQLNQKAEDLVRRGFSPDEAFRLVYAEAEKQQQSNSPQLSNENDSLLSGFGGMVGTPLIKALLGREKAEGPFDVASGTAGKFSERPKSEAYPYGAGSALTKHPKEFLSEYATQPLGALEQIIDALSLGSYGGIAQKLSGKEKRSASPVADYLRKLSGYENLPEEGKENIDIGNFAASFLPVMKLLGMTKTAQKAQKLAKYEQPLIGNDAKKLLGLSSKATQAMKAEPEAAQAVSSFVSRGNITKRLRDLETKERSILEPVVGKHAYENEYHGKGFEAQRRFWDKYGDRFDESQVKQIENLEEIETLRARERKLKDVKTSFYIEDDRSKGLENAIAEIRGPLIMAQDPTNKQHVMDAIDFLKNEGFSKKDIQQSVFKVLESDLSPGDLEFVLPELFGNIRESEKLASSIPRKERSLAGRISKAPETATELRVARTKPTQRIYPRSSNIAVREAQVKAYPKYEAEIAQDAAERAERAAKRVPKTVKGMDSKRLRVHEAEKNWPKAQDSYNRSAGRVRALEDEVASLKGEAKESAKGVLEAAKKDLEDATFQLKQSFENLKGVNVRAGKEAMRDAARKKIGQIQEAISAGEEYKIAKMDYNPEHITRAKYLAKRKPLPKTRTSDFYTDVHSEYVNEYKNRIAKIDQEIKGLPKNMQGLSQGRELHQEKNILDKMVASADAEKAIQNNRFALREISERKKAQERFAALKKAEGQPKVQKAAQEKMWKTRIQEIGSSEGRSNAAQEIIEDVARQEKDASKAAKIRSEKSNLEQALEDLNKEKEALQEKFSHKEAKEPPSGKGTKDQFGRTEHKKPPPFTKRAEESTRGIKETIENFINKVPFLKNGWARKERYAKDVVFGVGTALLDEFIKENELSDYITAGQGISLIFGRGNSGKGIRYVTNHIAKGMIKNWKIDQAAEIYRNQDVDADEKLSNYSPEIKKKARKRAFG